MKPNNPKYSEELIQECLGVLSTGSIDDIFDLIPRLGVLRDRRFNEHLLRFLNDDDLRMREFAACAMGAIGNDEFLTPLKDALRGVLELRGQSAEDFAVAVIEAIGSIGNDEDADFFSTMVTADRSSLSGRMRRSVIESLGKLAQQGGGRALEALVGLTGDKEGELRAQALSELSVAYWHRPNEISDSTLQRILDLTRDRNHVVAEAAVSALQSLADVGCRRAEKFFKKS